MSQANTQDGRRVSLPAAIPYAVCLGCMLLFTWRVAFLGWQPYMGRTQPATGRSSVLISDIPVQFLPWKWFAKENLFDGKVPLWNPYTYGGSPFLANYQSTVFYPVDLVLYLLPLRYHFGLSLLVHMTISIFLMLLLARSCGLSRWSSCLAALAYGLNGFVMIHIPFGNHLTYTAIAWTPGLFWAVLRVMRGPLSGGLHFLLLLFFVCMQLLSGHPQMAFYSFFFAFVFILAIGWGGGGKRTLSRGLGSFLIAGVLAGGLCAYQLLPTLEYIPLSGRESAVPFDQATEFSFAPHRLISLIAGEYYGSHIWENHWDHFAYWSSAYGGAILPFLALIGALTWRNGSRLRRGLLVVGALALFLACGRDNPVYRYILALPGFGYFRAPAKFLPWFILPSALLAGKGLDWGIEHLNRLKVGDTLRRHPSLPGIAIFGALCGVFLVLRFSGHQDAFDPVVIRVSALFVAAGWVVLAGCWYMGARLFPWLRGSVFAVGILVLLTADLWHYGYKYIDCCLVPPNGVWRWLVPPPEANYLHQYETQEQPFRVAMVGGVEYPNMTIPWQLHGLAGYDPMSLRYTMDLFAANEGWPKEKFVDCVKFERTDGNVYDLFNVQYLLTPGEISGPGLQYLTKGRYLQVVGRSGTPQPVKWFSDEETVYRSPQGPPRSHDDLQQLSWEQLEIDMPPPLEPEGAGAGQGSVAIRNWQAEEIVLEYEATKDGWLLLSLPWYPGREAVIGDDAPRRTIRAMHALSAIRVPAGKHTVLVHYRPASWWWGCLITVGTFCLLIFGTILTYWGRRGGSRTAPTQSPLNSIT